MKKIAFIILIFAVYQYWGDIARVLNPPPPRVHDGKVILYGTDWCGYCKQARDLLNSKHIPFEDIDIEKSKEGLAQYKQLGGNGIPLMVVNGEVIHGYSPEQIMRYYNN